MIKYFIELLDLSIAFVSCFGKFVVYNFSERDYYIPATLPDRLNESSDEKYSKNESKYHWNNVYRDPYLMSEEEILNDPDNLLDSPLLSFGSRVIENAAEDIIKKKTKIYWQNEVVFSDGSLIGELGASKYFLHPITKKAVSRGFHKILTSHGMLIGQKGALSYRLHPITKHVMYEVREC